MATTDPLIGAVVGDYTIDSLLGRGGMARVYLGFDQNLKRYAAIKVIDSHLISGEEREEYYSRFQREARAIAHLRHPNIVQIYRFGQVDDNYYMAMEFIAGEDLRQLLKTHKANGTMISNALILKITKAMTSALDYSHAHEVIHRDIKPSNILIMEDGTAILTDFGLALSVPEGTIGNTFGSVHYIAPEQAVSSAQAVAQSDLYSLAICVYEMLTGRVPFDDASVMSVALKQLSQLPPPPTELNPNIPVEVESVLLKSLEKEPEDRYQSGAEFYSALESAFARSNDEDTHSINVNRLSSEPKSPDLLQTNAEDVSIASPLNKSVIQKSTATMKAIPQPNPIKSFETTSEKLKELKAEENRSNRLMVILGGAALIILLVIIAVAAISSFSNGEEDITTPAVVVQDNTVIPPTSTDTVVVAGDLVTTIDANVAVDPAVSTATPTLTTTVATVEATNMVTPPTVTETPVPVTNELENFVTITLRYDASQLLLHNTTDIPIDVGRLVFVQMVPDDEPFRILAQRWERGNRGSTSGLPQDRCLQFYITTFTRPQNLMGCSFFNGWNAALPTEAFWINQSPDIDEFIVFQNEQQLTECSIDAGICEVPLPVSDS